MTRATAEYIQQLIKNMTNGAEQERRSIHIELSAPLKREAPSFINATDYEPKGGVVITIRLGNPRPN